MDDLFWDDDMRVWHIGCTDELRFDLCPLLATAAIFVTKLSEPWMTWYNDRWCYTNRYDAMEAFWAWDLDWPNTEPDGWIKHPGTGRYREGSDPSKEIHL